MQRRKERKGAIETAEDYAFLCDFAALREHFKQLLRQLFAGLAVLGGVPRRVGLLSGKFQSIDRRRIVCVV